MFVPTRSNNMTERIQALTVSVSELQKVSYVDLTQVIEEWTIDAVLIMAFASLIPGFHTFVKCNGPLSGIVSNERRWRRKQVLQNRSKARSPTRSARVA
jgi:hypothetical protein